MINTQERLNGVNVHIHRMNYSIMFYYLAAYLFFTLDKHRYFNVFDFSIYVGLLVRRVINIVMVPSSPKAEKELQKLELTRLFFLIFFSLLSVCGASNLTG